MSYRRSKQKIKITNQSMSNIVLLALLFLMFLFFLSFSIRNIIIYNQINHNDLKEYSGFYTILESHRPRNTIYYIQLENGDVLRVTPELLKEGFDFVQFSALNFTYSEPKFGLISAYTCVNISSTNSTDCYLESKDSLDEATTGIYVGTIISFLIICLLFLSICMLICPWRQRRKTVHKKTKFPIRKTD